MNLVPISVHPQLRKKKKTKKKTKENKQGEEGGEENIVSIPNLELSNSFDPQTPKPILLHP